MNIPFVNLRLQYESIQPEIDQALQEVFTAAQFIGGDPVKNFEAQFSQRFTAKHCIGTGNGTDSLFVILKSLGIGAGDEVVTPAFSCIASSETISLTGAKAVFADVDERFYTVDLSTVENKISSRTKAIIAVHLYGQAAPVQQLKEFCDKYNLYLIEDCAQAHLTEQDKKIAGTFGIASAFSFYPTKNLGAYGDAGCIITQDDVLAEKMRRFANHGALKKDDHAIEGTNSRLDTLQASILSVKLNHLLRWNEKRLHIAERYTELLKNIPQLILPAIRKNTNHTFHIYAIRSTQRNRLKDFLAKHGIETIIHYPNGLPFTQAYRHLSDPDFPVTAQLQNEVLSLPIYPELSDDQVTYIASTIKNYFLM